MRSKMLTTAVTAAAMLALAPAGASAAGHSSRARGAATCRLVIQVEPHVITNGEPVQVFGQLLCPGKTGEGQTVTVYKHSAGTPGYVLDGTATTAAAGFYSLPPLSGLSTDTTFYATALTYRSGKQTVKVAPQVTLEGPLETTPLLTGFRNRTTFTGKVNPADGGAEVDLQRENGAEEWGTIQKTTVTAQGGFTFIHTFVVPGEDANLRAVVRPHGPFDVRGTSNARSYAISQAENPKLTIVEKKYPISYGESVTITGVVKGGAGKTVTLTEHAVGKKPFETLTSVKANGSGEYEFVEKPTINTVYQTTSGTVKSAVIFEGVSYVLTDTAVSATKVQSGQSLTFTGTVTPSDPVVYLERQNTFGGGYHVANVVAPNSKGEFSITQFVFGLGKAVFRIKAPGNHENQAAASTPFPIEVTPAPPGSLKPVIPSKLPL